MIFDGEEVDGAESDEDEGATEEGHGKNIATAYHENGSTIGRNR